MDDLKAVFQPKRSCDSVSGDKYRIVKDLVVPVKSENGSFPLLSTLNIPACCSILLLTYFIFPISKSINMNAFIEVTTGFHSYIYVALSCGLQITYASCYVRQFRHYIVKLCTVSECANMKNSVAYF